jgi:mono/diheme cytochrome c family protein
LVRSQERERIRRAALRSATLAAFGGLWVALLLWPATGLAVPVESDAVLSFSARGEPVARHDLAWLKRNVEPGRVRVMEPYEQREVEFDALPLRELLDAVYGERWRSEEELLFTCRDGYEPSVPVRRVLEHRAWLAFARPDASGFEIDKLESGEHKPIDLSPFYLVWENLDDPLMLQESDYGWPYQLVAIDLIRSADRFPGLAPPDGASPEVVAGFRAYRVHCSKCHQLNGEGGHIGPELNATVNPVEYREAGWLRGWITDPGRINPGSRMPPLNPALPDRDRVVDEIIAYLRAKADERAAQTRSDRDATKAGRTPAEAPATADPR